MIQTMYYEQIYQFLDRKTDTYMGCVASRYH